jgi:hypothetical protein
MNHESDPNWFAAFDDAEQRPFQHENTGNALTAAHSKYLLALIKDRVDGDAGVQGSFRFTQAGRKTEAISDMNRKFVLSPKYGYAGRALISRLAITMIEKSWSMAGEKLRDGYYSNLLMNPATTCVDESLMTPNYVPTYDVFGTATNNEGDKLRFHVAPHGFNAIVRNADIVPAPDQYMLDGQYYDIRQSATVFAHNITMREQWFNLEQLQETLATYEPVFFDERDVSDYAA